MTIFGFLTEPAVIFLDCGGFSVMYNSLILETVIVLLYLMTNAIITFIIKNAVCRRIDFLINLIKVPLTRAVNAQSQRYFLS